MIQWEMRGVKMIDIQKAKKVLKSYVSNYDIKNNRIRVKIGHIERVAKIAKELAQSKQLAEEDIQLAELIGLLHDIGRFEQVKRYNTFNDKDSINHGKLGVEILFDQGMIREFIEDTQYDEIIRKAILNHNRNKNDMEVANDKELLHSKIIRDADKIDIIYMLSFEDKETAWGSSNIEKEKITDEIYQQFIEDKQINYSKRKTGVDVLVSHFAYVFDLNSNYALQMIKEKKYYDTIYQRFKFEEKETKERINQIYEIVRNLKKEGHTIIYVTNNMSEILLADRILILENGNIKTIFSKEEIFEKMDFLTQSQIKIPEIVQIIAKLKQIGKEICLQEWTGEEMMQEILKVCGNEK